MFEDVFEPFDDIVGEDVDATKDEWGEVWDTGEKEDVWRSGGAKNVWTTGTTGSFPAPPKNIPVPSAPTSGSSDIDEPTEEVACESCPDPDCESCGDPDCEEGCGDPDSDCGDCGKPSKGTGLFDDLFLDIF